MNVQRFTTTKLADDLESRGYLAVLVIAIGLVLGLIKDYPSVIAENRWSQLFGGFELTLLGLFLFIANRQQLKTLDGLRLEIHEAVIRVCNSEVEHDLHRSRRCVSVKANTVELVDGDRAFKLELARFGDFKQRPALKNAVEEWGKGSSRVFQAPTRLF